MIYQKLVNILFFLWSINMVHAQERPVYSFFTAGHTYGHPSNFQYGLHPPLVDYISKLNDHKYLELGILTGDVVPFNTNIYWDSAQVDIDRFNVPIHIAAGNHDIGDEFVMRYEDYYKYFVIHNDLFIILTPGLNQWNIESDQLDFLKATLEDNYLEVNNIFIFLHELIWWSPTNKYKNIKINYEPHYPGTTNFESVVKPLLQSYPNNITIFAGDVGCCNNVSSFMYDSFDNISLVASGMGGGVQDNIIITDVYEDGSVYYNLVAINGIDEDALGELYDNEHTSVTKEPENHNFIFYPNPVKEILNLKSRFKIQRVFIFNELGINVLVSDDETNINTSNLGTGIYYCKVIDVKGNIELARFIKN